MMRPRAKGCVFIRLFGKVEGFQLLEILELEKRSRAQNCFSYHRTTTTVVHEHLVPKPGNFAGLEKQGVLVKILVSFGGVIRS